MTSTEPSPPGGPEQRQRLAAYAVIRRPDAILLSRLSAQYADRELWTLPGGGVEFGEDPVAAVVREVAEETGLTATIDGPARVHSAARVVPDAATGEPVSFHSVRLIFDGRVPADAPQPRVVEENGSTVDARWVPWQAILDGSWPLVPWVAEVLAEATKVRIQRLAVKAVARREGRILLARLSGRAVQAGAWTLPGGGVDHGEPPRTALVREVAEETGLAATVGRLLDVHDVRFTGTAPDGRLEDFHAVNLIFAVDVDDADPEVREVGGTTDAAAWIAESEIAGGAVPVTEIVRHALAFSHD